MFRTLINLFVASSMLLPSVAQATAIKGDPGQFFYRYKTPVLAGYQPEMPQDKDITAFFVGGVGYAFSEKLPMKADWQDDEWRIVSGTLPDGITFDASTQTFTGTPTTEGKGTVVELEGFDGNGNSVATAAANFDVYTVQGTPVAVDLYAHTGKYKVDTLSIPAGITVDNWRRVYMPPDGIAVNGPYFEGTPTKAGVYPVFIQGLNYMGEVVATFHGKYTVEDGPTFPHIPDDVRKLPQLEWGFGAWFNFGAPTPHKPNRLINPAKQASYFLELETGEELPYGVASNQVSKNLNLQGYATKPYDTAKIRFKAIDSDATIGYSNWFSIGTSDPSPGCYPFYQGYPLTVKTGTPSKISVPRPFGTQGDVSYHLVSGAFPDGLGLDSATGQITGTPTLAGEKTDINIRIDVTNGSNTVSTNCAYRMEVVPGGVRLSDATPEQLKHIRAGDVFNGTLGVVGGIPAYNVEFKTPSDWPTLAFTSPTQNAPSVTVSGPIDTSGNKKVDFALNNGDTTRHDGRLSIYSHGPLDTGVIPTIEVQRLGYPQAWGSIPYDASTVIPDVKDQGKFPQFVLSPAGALPRGIQLGAADFYGTTDAAVGTYGPLTVTMTDFSGQTKQSNQFNVEVTPRAPIQADSDGAHPALTPPVFTVEWDTEQFATPFRVKQPYGASKFAITWTLDNLSGEVLPSWLSFDRSNGRMTALKGIPIADIGTYGPFTVTATDEEGSTVTSEEFEVTTRDWPLPDAKVIPPRLSNVTGDTAEGETPTFVNIQNLKYDVFENTVIGGVNAVRFLSADPVSPAGLTFDAADGSLSGVPTEEFNGDVAITFEDARQRRGTMTVPLRILPYPAVAMTAAEYEVPRLSVPAISATTLHGFWNPARFEWDATSTPLPSGLTVTSDGTLQGKTDAAVGTVVSGIRLLAKTTAPDGTTLTARTAPFSIRVAEPAPITLSYAPDTAVYRLEGMPGSYTLAHKTSALPVPGGSYVAPVTFILDQSQAQADGMTGTISINRDNGTIIGQPDRLGKWTVFVNMKDAEGRAIAAPVPVTIWATLYGYVERSNGGGSQTLRAGEPFVTDPLTVRKFVGTPVFSTSPAALPSAPVFDATTGAFTDDGAFEQPLTNFRVYVDVKDDDGRTFHPSDLPVYTFNVIPPLAVTVAASKRAVATRQYSAADGDPIDAAFAPTVSHKMGNIRYGLSGNMPGTLAMKVYDDAGAFLHYAYTDAYGTARQEDDASKLPLDALVFDTIAATLKGIPSQAGTFGGIKLAAYDDHQTKYIKAVPSQMTNNTAYSEDITITVAPAHPLVAANMVGAEERDDDTAYQYTTVPSLRSVTANAAYGKAPTWTIVSGELPQGVSEVKGKELSYAGYPEVRGTFPDIAWKATDAAGRTVNTEPATIKVEPRKELELVATNPVGLVVNDTVANVSVTPRFTAYGRAIPQSDWTVTGVSNLPPGIGHAIENNRVVFTGTATVIGTYKDIVVSAKDSLGSRASINMTFNVILPTDAIVLDVSNIKTKANVPFEMQATSSNTYGKVRYYSYDITDGLADQLKLDPTTGLVSGAFNSAQNLDFDVYVTDESNRVTTRPVLVEVMPDIRVTVPQIVELEPSTPQQQTVATDYVLGTVSYEQGNPADWPVGITVDPLTGTIKSDGTTPIGEYPSLTIVATDTFTRVGQTFADRETSNVFTVKIDTNGPYVALTGGDIAPWSKRKAGYSQAMNDVEFLEYKNIGLGEIAFTFPSQATGKRVPPGLSISSAGLITGTPTESGDFEFDVQAAYKSNSKIKSAATYRIHIDLLPLTLELADGTLPQAESGKAYSFDFKTLLTSDNVPVASLGWAKTNVDPTRPLPSGLVLSNGVLSGTPTGADDYDFTVKVSYTNNNPEVEKIDHTRQYRLYVKKAAPYFTYNIANVTKAIKQAVTITPSVANKHVDDKYELVGDFPVGLFYDGVTPITPGDTAPGLMFDKTTGVISGATKVSGDFPVQIRVTDKLGQTAVSNTFNLKFLDTVPTFVGEMAPKSGIEKYVYVPSNPILISGNTAAAPTTLTVSAGAASYFRVCTGVNEAQTGTCTSTQYNVGSAPNLTSGTYLQVFLRSANVFDTEVVATLTVGGVVREFSVTTRSSDTTPDDLGTFAPVTGAELSTYHTSSVVKVEGITDATPAKLEIVEGVEHYTYASVWSCKFTSNAALSDCSSSTSYGTEILKANGSATTVSNGTYLQLRVRSSSAYATPATVRLTVGGVVREFSVTTRSSDTTPDDLGTFAPVTGAELSTYHASAVVKVEGITDNTSAKLEIVEGVEHYTYASAWSCKFSSYAALSNCSSSTSYGAEILKANGSPAVVSNGTYLQLRVRSSSAYATPATVRLTVGGVVREFSVTTRSSDTTPDGLGSFAPVAGAERSTYYASSVVKVEGITDATSAKLEIVEGVEHYTYASVWSCKFTSSAALGDCSSSTSYGTKILEGNGSPAVVSNGTYLQLRVRSSSSYATPATVRLTVGGVVREFSVTTKADANDLGGDTQFVDVMGAERSSQVGSNLVQINGLPSSSTASLAVVEGTGTAYAYVCTAGATANCYPSTYKAQITTTTPRTVTNGDYVKLVVTSSSSFDTPTTLRLTVNGQDRLWTVRTRPTDTVPDDLGEFATVTGAEINTRVASNAIKITGITDPTPATFELVSGTSSTNNALYICPSAADGLSNSCWSGTAKTHGQSFTLAPDSYIQLAAYTSGEFDTESTVKVTVGGIARTFTVRTRPTDTVPDNLGGFATVTGAERNTRVASNAIKITGITDPTPATFELVSGTSSTNNALYICPSAADGLSNSCWSGTAKTHGQSFTLAPDSYIQLAAYTSGEFDTESTVKVTVGGIVRTFTVRTRPTNTVPVDLGEFATVSERERSVRVPSNVIKVTGITDNTTATLERLDGVPSDSYGTIYICAPSAAKTGDCFASGNHTSSRNAAPTSFTIAPDSYIQLTLLSSSSYDTTARLKLTVGGVERIFEVRTRAMDTTPENLGAFTDATNAALNSIVTSDPIIVTDIKEAAPVTVTVVGSPNATTKVFTCTPSRATSATSTCHVYPTATGTAGGTAVTIADGYYIALQTKAASTPETDVKVTVTVGDVTRDWIVRTAPE